ncbi:MAG: hypothetical protein CM1200mP30_07180 [Pseudomonadota bacterium]|nr:MAG: hypothetical protein CM1200mP30_07180 [Pseudomonadota bacterium]
MATKSELLMLNGTVAALETESEIQVRGLNLMQGYLKNPEATREAFTTDGWYRTGDLGKMDSDGYIFVTGRLKELIIKGGRTYHLEKLMTCYTGIRG